MAATTVSPIESAQTVSANLNQLRGIQGINCQNLIVASDGATVLVGENVSQAAGGGVIAPHSFQSNAPVSQTINMLTVESEKRADEVLRSNPWVSGSFYLTVVVVILATLMAAGKILSPWLLPPIIIAAVLLVCTVGALQLRNDSKLSETNFLLLMRMTFRGLSSDSILSETEFRRMT